MKIDFPMRPIVAILASLSLAACGGGGGGGDTGGGGTTNRAPVANAGPDQSVDELAAVNLDGTGSSDPDGDTITYQWTEVGGSTVTLTGADTATPSFTAPDVLAANTPVVITFRLTVNDGALSRSDDVAITVNDVGLGANSPPTANAGPDQNVQENTTVNLDGTGSSDADGDTLSFSWTQTGGNNVGLTGANTATPSFTAPNVAVGVPETFTFQLTVNDGTDTDTDSVSITVSEGQSAVAISGKLFYEMPAIRLSDCRHDFSNPIAKPIRRAPVELRSGGVAIDSTVTDDQGNYSFSNVAANTSVSIRVLARSIKSTGLPLWNVEVRDNTSLITSPLPDRPLYAKEWASFNTGATDITNRDFVALTGWDTNTSSYVNDDRDAAPFAILDMLVDGIIYVTTADPSVNMGSLDAFWSINNSWALETTATGAEVRNYDTGEVGNTHFTSNPQGSGILAMFLLGDADGIFPHTVAIDTDEFDRGVVQHEWGHYFEVQLSRSDSIGGRHVIPGTLEARTAFGEGWGYGISAIIGGEPVLCDTGRPGFAGSRLDIENWGFYGTHGFFNEMSIATFLYDAFDPANEADDTGELGFTPIYNVMRNPQRTTEAFTTIYSFATYLKAQLSNPADLDFVDSLLARESIGDGALDIWGSGQTIQPAGADFLPIYENLLTDGSVLQVCTNSDYDPDLDGNKPGEWRYLRFTTTGAAQDWDIVATAAPGWVPPPTSDPDPDAQDRSDPDMWMYLDGGLINICPGTSCYDTGSGVSGDPDTETMQTQVLPADTYVIAFNDWRYSDPNIANDYPSEVCFDITANPH